MGYGRSGCFPSNFGGHRVAAPLPRKGTFILHQSKYSEADIDLSVAQREDEKERKKAVYAINFDAL